MKASILKKRRAKLLDRHAKLLHELEDLRRHQAQGRDMIDKDWRVLCNRAADCATLMHENGLGEECKISECIYHSVMDS